MLYEAQESCALEPKNGCEPLKTREPKEAMRPKDYSAIAKKSHETPSNNANSQHVYVPQREPAKAVRSVAKPIGEMR